MVRELLTGLKILIVEDDPLIAMDLQDFIAQAGAVVIGPAHNVRNALKLIESNTIDLAVLDYRLENETSGAIAERLHGLKVPFLFHTSFRGTIESDHPGIPILDKPAGSGRLISALQALTSHL